MTVSSPVNGAHLPDRSQDHSDLCRLLDKLAPGVLPRDVFHAMARLIVTATFVVVPLLRQGNRIFVLLHERDLSDLYYPSMLNTPGTVIRATDEDLSTVYRRLISTELAGVPIRRGPVFVHNVYERIVRGREVSLVHWVELEDGISSAHLIDVEMLPDRVVPTDQPRIRMAAAHFQASVEAVEP